MLASYRVHYLNMPRKDYLHIRRQMPNATRHQFQQLLRGIPFPFPFPFPSPLPFPFPCPFTSSPPLRQFATSTNEASAEKCKSSFKYLNNNICGMPPKLLTQLEGEETGRGHRASGIGHHTYLKCRVLLTFEMPKINGMKWGTRAHIYILINSCGSRMLRRGVKRMCAAHSKGIRSGLESPDADPAIGGPRIRSCQMNALCIWNEQDVPPFGQLIAAETATAVRRLSASCCTFPGQSSSFPFPVRHRLT